MVLWWHLDTFILLFLILIRITFAFLAIFSLNISINIISDISDPESSHNKNNTPTATVRDTPQRWCGISKYILGELLTVLQILEDILPIGPNE